MYRGGVGRGVRPMKRAGTFDGTNHFSSRAIQLHKEIQRLKSSREKVVTSSILHGYSQSFKRGPFINQLRDEYSSERKRAAVS